MNSGTATSSGVTGEPTMGYFTPWIGWRTQQMIPETCISGSLTYGFHSASKIRHISVLLRLLFYFYLLEKRF
jgi:hypothetical protein